ncbi:MAG: hypothetical protein MJD61_21695 [Proteobacteria bacterium]|nr:hypothetical protein [Pseudomonadota bacterium]
MADVKVRVAGGKQGQALGLEGELLTLALPSAQPPGKPLELVCQLPEGSVRLSARTVGSKRQQDGSFRVRVRLVCLRRQVRQALQAALVDPHCCAR